MASLIRRPGTKVFYLQYWQGPKARRKSLHTTSWQLAREKLRQFESAMASGEESCLPAHS